MVTLASPSEFQWNQVVSCLLNNIKDTSENKKNYFVLTSEQTWYTTPLDRYEK